MTVKINNNAFTINDQNYVCADIYLDYTTIIGLGKPTKVTRGVFQSFSLPIFASDDEQLHITTCIPTTWDGTNPLVAQVYGYIDTANTDKRFKLQLDIDPMINDVIVPTGTYTTTREEALSGAKAQYTAINSQIVIDAAGQGYSHCDFLGMRLRRVASSQDEIAGEYVVSGFQLYIPIDKAGSASI